MLVATGPILERSYWLLQNSDRGVASLQLVWAGLPVSSRKHAPWNRSGAPEVWASYVTVRKRYELLFEGDMSQCRDRTSSSGCPNFQFCDEPMALEYPRASNLVLRYRPKEHFGGRHGSYHSGFMCCSSASISGGRDSTPEGTDMAIKRA